MVAFGFPGHASAQGLTEEYSRACGVPVGYDCATPGFETPLTLDQAIELSRTETVVYLYGPGIIDARIVADVITRDDGRGETTVPAVAVPGIGVPEGALYVVVLGRVVRHRVSGEPVEFYQRYLDRGEIFGLTRAMAERQGYRLN